MPHNGVGVSVSGGVTYGRYSERTIFVSPRRRAVAARRRGLFRIGLLVTAIFSVVTAFGHFAQIHETGYSFADQFTRALLRHDVRPILATFDPAVRADIVNDIRLGALCDEVAALGTYIGVTESNGAEGARIFTARFSRGFAREEFHYSGGHVISVAVDVK